MRGKPTYATVASYGVSCRELRGQFVHRAPGLPGRHSKFVLIRAQVGRVGAPFAGRAARGRAGQVNRAGAVAARLSPPCPGGRPGEDGGAARAELGAWRRRVLPITARGPGEGGGSNLGDPQDRIPCGPMIFLCTNSGSGGGVGAIAPISPRTCANKHRGVWAYCA